MKVEIVAKTVGLGKYQNLNSAEIISAIARHGIIKEDNGKLVKYLMDNKHWSPLDMINFVFEIETSRAIGRQILRHKSMSFQEHSQRYSSRVIFEKIDLRKEHPTNRQSSTDNFDTYVSNELSNKIDSLLESIDEVYKYLLDRGVAKECARMILPECTTTTISINGSLRSWLSFLNVRCEEHSQKEVRQIAEEIGNILEKEMPNIFKQIDWRNGLFM